MLKICKDMNGQEYKWPLICMNYNMVGMAVAMVISTMHEKSCIDSHNGPLTRFVKLRVVRAPGMLSPPPASKETTSLRSRHASRHVCHARAWCMSGSLTRDGGENVPGIPGACATHNFTYLQEAHARKFEKNSKIQSFTHLAVTMIHTSCNHNDVTKALLCTWPTKPCID